MQAEDGDARAQARNAYQQTLAGISSRLGGDDSAVLREILELIGGRTDRALAARFGGALTDADREDALSIALFRLWLDRRSFDPARARLDRWFYVLARNAAIDLIRARERRREVDIGGDLEKIPVPEEHPAAAGNEALRDALAAALRELSEADRRILLSGLTESELSRELNLRPGAIRARRLRSKKRLRELLRVMGRGD